MKVYLCSDGMKHLIVDFPQYGAYMTLCGHQDSFVQKKGRALNEPTDCSDCESALAQAKEYLEKETK